MINLTPEIAVQKLLWIIEVQAHINDCCETLPNDHECMAVASELQDKVDDEWERLRPLIGDRPKPHSTLTERSRHPEPGTAVGRSTAEGSSRPKADC